MKNNQLKTYKSAVRPYYTGLEGADHDLRVNTGTEFIAFETPDEIVIRPDMSGAEAENAADELNAHSWVRVRALNEADAFQNAVVAHDQWTVGSENA